jgi:hypothetical protein
MALRSSERCQRRVLLARLQLELVEFKNSVSLDAIRQRFPAVDDRAKVQGFSKLAFRVANIEHVAELLKQRKAQIIRGVTYDQETGAKWLIVTDNDGNWLQFFEAHHGA